MLKEARIVILSYLLSFIFGAYNPILAQNTSKPASAKTPPQACADSYYTALCVPFQGECFRESQQSAAAPKKIVAAVTPISERVESAREKAVFSPSQIVTPAPSPLSQGNLNSDVIFNLINAHRVRIGLHPFEKDANLCSLAQSRGAELAGEVASGRLHSGLYGRNLSYWVTENMKYGGNEEQTVAWWLNSPIHRAAIEGSYKYSCGECAGNTCAELFTSYTPKVKTN